MMAETPPLSGWRGLRSAPGEVLRLRTRRNLAECAGNRPRSAGALLPLGVLEGRFLLAMPITVKGSG